MFLISLAACAAAFGSFEVTVCGAPPLVKVLLVVTEGEAGLPLGRFAWFGTGEARFGGADVATGPFGCAIDRGLVVAMLTCVTVISVLAGEMTCPAWAVLVLWTRGPLLSVILLSMVLVSVDFDDTDMTCYSMPGRAPTCPLNDRQEVGAAYRGW